jgi:hypothetical protein
LQKAVTRAAPEAVPGEPFGDGRAAERVVAQLEAWSARGLEALDS